jgi:hypothetical protein
MAEAERGRMPATAAALIAVISASLRVRFICFSSWISVP